MIASRLARSPVCKHPPIPFRAALLAVAACFMVVTVEASDTPARQPDPKTKTAVNAAPQIPHPLRFIRVYAPAEQPQLWPRDQGRYLPIDSDDFQRLLEDARASQAGSFAPKANVAAALYQAHLDEDGDLQATASLSVVTRHNEAVLMPLEPCRFAVRNPRWSAPAADSNNETDAAEKKTLNRTEAAVLGTHASGQTELLVERSGKLTFEWTLRGLPMRQSLVTPGKSNKNDRVEYGPSKVADLEFDIDLPKCPTNVFLLDLPENITPQTDYGIIGPAKRASQESSPQRLVRWRIDLGGHNRMKLRLARNEASDGAAPAVSVKQSLVYDFAQRGLEVSSDFRLDVSSTAINRVSLLVDSPLRVIRAQCGDRDVNWSVLSDPEGKTGHVSLELPEPIHGAGRSLQVWAYAPLVLDRAWPLPRIQVKSATSKGTSVRTRNVLWQQGKATLLVADPLELLDIKSRDFRISKTGSLPQPDSGESLELQLFSADVRPQVVLSRAQSLPSVDLGIATRLDAGDMTAWVTAKLRSNRKEHFQIAAELAPQWIVDSVESQPPDFVADWQVENDDGGSRRLAVRLSKPLSPRRGTLRLIVGLRNPRSPLGRKLSVNDLVPLDFTNCEKGESLLAIQAVEPHQLKTWGDASLSLVEAATLGSDDLSLFAQTPQGLVAHPRHAAESLRVSLQRRRPTYDATIRVDARTKGDFLLESYQIRCVPRSSRVERVLIHFSQSRESAPRWWLGAEDNQQIIARRLPAAEEAAAGLDGGGEAWEISLRQPRSAAFEIGAGRTTKLAKKTPICLAALPEASKQKATLVTHSADVTSRRFENHRLEPISSEPTEVDQYSSSKATYRYNPLQTVSSPEQVMLTVLPTAVKEDTDQSHSKKTQARIPSAWAWSCQLQSCYNTDGVSQHSARYLIENAGRDRLALTLPQTIEPTDVQGIWVNDQPVTWQTTNTEEVNCLRIDLPIKQRFPVVTVHYSTADSPLGTNRSLRPPLPTLDIPTLSQFWTAWLPPGYSPLVAKYETVDGYAPPLALPSLTQRLLGPLGRPPYGNTFDPFLAKDWKSVAADLFDFSQNDRAVVLLLEQISRLAQQANVADINAFDAKDANSVKSTASNSRVWCTILANESLATAARPLLVDSHAFAQAGLWPQTAANADLNRHLPPAPLPPILKSTTLTAQPNPTAEATSSASVSVSSEKAMGRAIRLLRRSGLAVLVHDEAILLTTSARAAVYASYLKPMGGDVVWRVCPGPLSDWISTSAAGDKQPDNVNALVPASLWARSPVGPNSPWSTALPTAFQTADTPGWTAVRLDISGEEVGHLTVVHLQTLGLFRWSAFILAVALGCWKGMNHPMRMSLGLAIFAILALLGPIIVSTIASGATLGLMFCLLLRLIRRKPANANPHSSTSKSDPSSSLSTAAYIGPGIVLVFAMLWPNPAGAEAPKPDVVSSTDHSKTYRVLVPTNEKREASGKRIFVPEEFYRRLHSQASTVAGRPQGWLLTSAIYNGTLLKQGQPERLSIDSLQAVFELRLFDRTAQVRIPLCKQDVSIEPATCLLDGRSVQPQWSEDGRALIVPVEQAGRHRLELSLRPSAKRPPKPQATNGNGGKAKDTSAKSDTTAEQAPGGELNVSIPPLNNSLLQLILPVGERTVEVPSARGPVKNENGRLTAELGAAERLSIRWLDDTTRSLVKPSFKADELLWLKILPGSVVVDAKFTIQVDAGQVHTLALEVDPGLRLLEHGQTAADIVEVPGKPHARLIQLTEPCTDEVVVTARFLLRNASGVGNVRPPRLRLANATSATRRLAVSIAPTLDSRTQNDTSPTPLDISTFMASWGADQAKPDSAYSLADLDPTWSISTHPRRPPIDFVQTLEVTFSQKRTEVRLNAKLTDTPGYGFKYRLTSPAEMIIDKVSLIEEGIQRVSRWSRADDGTLSIFLTGPATVERNLSVQGHIKTPPQGNINVPTFHLQDGRPGSTRIALLRDRSVLVSIIKSSGLIESDWPSVVKIVDRDAGKDNSQNEIGLSPTRLVKSFIADDIQPLELQIALTPNLPKTKMVQATILAPDGDTDATPWTATVDIQIAVSNGLLDEVILDVPEEFGGPYALRQPGTIKVINTPDRQRRLVVRPHAPLLGEGRLTISSPLSSEPVSAPRITPSGCDKLTQLLVLPKRNGRESISWETRGLKKTSLPDNYEIVDSRFRAVLASSQHGQGNATVQLADVNVVWRDDETCTGTATFDLLPNGRLWCPLWLPDQYKLIETRLDHAICVPLADGEANSQGRSYRIQLASRTLPQRIQVVFSGRLRSDQWRDSQPWDAPRLGELPVIKTLWQVCGPRRFAPAQPATTADRLRHELLRLENMAHIIEQGIDLPNRKAADLLNWYRPWARRYAAVQHEVRRILPTVNEPQLLRSAEDLLQRTENGQLEVAKKLQAEDILNRWREELPPAVEVNSLWQTTLASPRRPTALFTRDNNLATNTATANDDSGTGDLSFIPRSESGIWTRLYAVLAVIAAIGLIRQGTRGGLLPTLARRWPQLLGVIAGLLWWLFLNPSPLGLIIVAVCLIASLRSPWPNNQPSDSVIVPLS